MFDIRIFANIFFQWINFPYGAHFWFLVFQYPSQKLTEYLKICFWIVFENYDCPDFGQMIVTKLQSISNQWRCGGLLEYLCYDPILIIFGVILKLCNSTQFWVIFDPLHNALCPGPSLPVTWLNTILYNVFIMKFQIPLNLS